MTFPMEPGIAGVGILGLLSPMRFIQILILILALTVWVWRDRRPECSAKHRFWKTRSKLELHS